MTHIPNVSINDMPIVSDEMLIGIMLPFADEGLLQGTVFVDYQGAQFYLQTMMSDQLSLCHHPPLTLPP